MVNPVIIVHRILVLSAVTQFANAAAKCLRSPDAGIVCENADKGVIERLAIYYENDDSLRVENSSISILESGMFEGLKFVEKLSLTRCGIRIIQDGVFRGLNLTHLNLARNSIREISEKIFADLTALRFLDLSHNAISRFELAPGDRSLPKLVYIDVSNNRLENFSVAGNFSELETINFENNSLRQFGIDAVLRLPKIAGVFLGGNSFNQSYESFLSFILMTSNVEIDSENSNFEDGWNTGKNSSTTIPKNSTSASQNNLERSIRSGIEKDFQLSPEVIKFLDESQLKNLVERILTLRNFTLNEREMLENDRKLVQDESRNVKKEYTRISQIIKRFKEVSGEARQESIGEYIEKSCQGMPDDTWWKRFKKWKCKKLFNWVKRLISG